MYDIKPLEEEWKQYQKNKKKPLIVWTSVFLAFVGILLLLWQYKYVNFSNFSFSNKKKMDYNAENKYTHVFINEPIFSLQVHQKELVTEIKPEVQPSIQSMNADVMPTLPVINDIPVFDNTPPVKSKIVVSEAPIKSKIVVSEAPKIKRVQRNVPRKKMHLNIIKSSTVSAYKDVEKRFYQSHDTDDSLFLAKSYYRKGNYKKSEYWSLQTNKINSNIEESWMIFIKSKIKLGHKNQAIRILTNYAKKSNSSVAWNLLLKLKK